MKEMAAPTRGRSPAGWANPPSSGTLASTVVELPVHADASTELAPLPEVPEPLAAVIHRALARRPADRFPDVHALAKALKPFAAA